jgi:single-strand DNA-binding protein
MSFAVNRVILGGRLVRDPNIKYTPSATAMVSNSIAVNTKRKGEDDVSFIDVTFWRQTAELVAKNFRKGQPILIEGRLTQERWTGKDGQNRSKVSVTAEKICFLPKEEAQPQQQQLRQTPEPEAQAKQDDEIPF